MDGQGHGIYLLGADAHVASDLAKRFSLISRSATASQLFANTHCTSTCATTTCVPILPQVKTADVLSHEHSGDSSPICNYAFTDFKSQGQTIERVTIDLDTCQRFDVFRQNLLGLSNEWGLELTPQREAGALMRRRFLKGTGNVNMGKIM